MTRVLSSHVRLDGVLEIVFDEGRINRIRILNRNIYAIYGFKKELQLSEGEIFNLIIVEQELERIQRKFNLKDLKYTLRANQAIPGSFDLYIMADSFKGRSFGFVLDNDEFSLVPRISFRTTTLGTGSRDLDLGRDDLLAGYQPSQGAWSIFPSFWENFRPFVSSKDLKNHAMISTYLLGGQFHHRSLWKTGSRIIQDPCRHHAQQLPAF